jgi:chromosome segregation ATPase
LSVAKEDLVKETRRLEAALATAKDESNKLETKITDLTSDLNKVNAEKAALQVIIHAHDEVSSEKDKLSIENATLAQKVADLQTTFVEATSKQASLATDNASLRQNLSELQRLHAELQQTLDDRVKRVAECEDVVAVKTEENKKLADEMNTLRGKVASIVKDTEDRVAQCESLKNQANDVLKMLASEKDNPATIQLAVAKLQQQVAKATRVVTVTDNKVIIPIENRDAAKDAVDSEEDTSSAARLPDPFDVKGVIEDRASSLAASQPSSLTASQRDNDFVPDSDDDKKVDITTMSQPSASAPAADPASAPAVASQPPVAAATTTTQPAAAADKAPDDEL